MSRKEVQTGLEVISHILSRCPDQIINVQQLVRRLRLSSSSRKASTEDDLFLLEVIHHILLKHPNLSPYVEKILRLSRGFSYDFNLNGERELLERFARVSPALTLMSEHTKVSGL